ncbi:ACP S-malonyltransferase [Clostridium grantii]|uniref:Malonyl CoA-acyl carrier protein transacylase n=1 Tax=Clostridium grantii DSM 8605 TaxID=1121316 RepID=A0A1M5W495_9CLOT|nr:ACP S-malonyltransferase [Clostridium grantii]SHH82295.1 [acyl-carrier-protein] S-malonyltransferase [Clostridium grantii DSM 8605]
MGKIGLIFAGQGAQYVGMGKDLFENIPASKEIFNIADRELGYAISEICFNGSEEDINKTENTQPAVLTVSIAALKALEEKGIKADMVAGLSLGEYSALVCSNAIEFEDAVKLVRKRGKFMQEAVPQGVGGMAAILGLDRNKIAQACEESSEKGVVSIANYNCPGQIVIAGEKDALKLACKKAEELGAKRVIELSVSGPFHTKLLKPAADKLFEELKNIQLKEIIIPVITNVTADYIGKKEDVKNLLKEQVMSSVFWEDTINKMLEDGVDTFIEVGPGKALSGFVKKINRKVKIYNVEDINSLNKTIEGLKA